MDWRNYQEEAAEFFRTLGMDARTDAKVSGVRTSHDVDVLVKSQYAGFDVTWIIECKQWSSKVSKNHVLSLRQIVIEVGADRGILLAERGFHSGAIEAAALTNVSVTSLAELRETTRVQVFSMRLRELYDRIETAKEKYWSISKSRRIECGLRPDSGAFGYSGDRVAILVSDLLTKAFRNVYPIKPDEGLTVGVAQLPALRSIEDLVSAVEPLVQELEQKLASCDAS